MGAWIETLCAGASNQKYLVAPFMGAWIETLTEEQRISYENVAPFMGAWIETASQTALNVLSFCRTLHGCVD